MPARTKLITLEKYFTIAPELIYTAQSHTGDRLVCLPLPEWNKIEDDWIKSTCWTCHQYIYIYNRIGFYITFTMIWVFVQWHDAAWLHFLFHLLWINFVHQQLNRRVCNTFGTDALMLKHQPISTHSADRVYCDESKITVYFRFE